MHETKQYRQFCSEKCEREFDQATNARRIARKVLKAGAVRVIPDKRRKPAKHKKPFEGE